jgi:TolA-binding protein
MNAPGTNGNGFWRDLTMREFVLLIAAIGPALLGVAVMEYQVRVVQSNYVSRTDLQLAIQQSPQGVTAVKIEDLTEQLRNTTTEVEKLREELERQNNALLKQEGRR